MDKTTIQQARQTNLAEYLLSIGVPLIRTGNRYRHKEHDSLTFTANAYYWNSRQEKGNAIDYLVNHMGMEFVEAVSALVNTSTTPIGVTGRAPKIFSFDQISISQSLARVSKYLNKDRHIGSSVINYLVDNRLLFQEVHTNNAIFPMYDEKGDCIGAEVQGTTSKRFKGVKADSKYGYGFNVRFSNNNEYDYALFFESAIDLISFIDCKKNRERRSLDRCILVSMAGLKPNILKHTLKTFGGNLKPIICVDNDEAGRAFINELKRTSIPFSLRFPNDEFKDWNEQLTALKVGGKPIERLINHQRSLTL